MNMSTLPSAAAAATDLPPVDLRPRRLADDVFQSAEEAVLAEGQADAAEAYGERLEELFPGRVAAHDPFTSVAGGLAIASFHGYVFRQGQPVSSNL